MSLLASFPVAVAYACISKVCFAKAASSGPDSVLSAYRSYHGWAKRLESFKSRAEVGDAGALL